MTSKKKRGGLGRGMDALFQGLEETPGENEYIQEIPLNEIRSNPYQPRKHFDEEALQELADSIKQSGVFQPVIIRKSTVKGYELIAGERRVRASRLAGNQTIPAIIRDMDEQQMIEIAVLENLQREDLSPLEEAEAYQVLMDKLALTQVEVAERMGKSRPYIANYLRLLSLPEEVKPYVGKELSMGQARTILGLKDKNQITQVAERVIKEGLTVRQLEDLVQQLNATSKTKSNEKKTHPDVQKPQHILAIEERFEEILGTSTQIVQRGKRGKIEIEFLSEEDLIRILDLLKIKI